MGRITGNKLLIGLLVIAMIAIIVVMFLKFGTTAGLVSLAVCCAGVAGGYYMHRRRKRYAPPPQAHMTSYVLQFSPTYKQAVNTYIQKILGRRGGHGVTGGGWSDDVAAYVSNIKSKLSSTSGKTSGAALAEIDAVSSEANEIKSDVLADVGRDIVDQTHMPGLFDAVTSRVAAISALFTAQAAQNIGTELRDKEIKLNADAIRRHREWYYSNIAGKAANMSDIIPSGLLSTVKPSRVPVYSTNGSQNNTVARVLQEFAAINDNYSQGKHIDNKSDMKLLQNWILLEHFPFVMVYVDDLVKSHLISNVSWTNSNLSNFVNSIIEQYLASINKQPTFVNTVETLLMDEQFRDWVLEQESLEDVKLDDQRARDKIEWDNRTTIDKFVNIKKWNESPGENKWSKVANWFNGKYTRYALVHLLFINEFDLQLNLAACSPSTISRLLNTFWYETRREDMGDVAASQFDMLSIHGQIELMAKTYVLQMSLSDNLKYIPNPRDSTFINNIQRSIYYLQSDPLAGLSYESLSMARKAILNKCEPLLETIAIYNDKYKPLYKQVAYAKNTMSNLTAQDFKFVIRQMNFKYPKNIRVPGADSINTYFDNPSASTAHAMHFEKPKAKTIPEVAEAIDEMISSINEVLQAEVGNDEATGKLLAPDPQAEPQAASEDKPFLKELTSRQPQASANPQQVVANQLPVGPPLGFLKELTSRQVQPSAKPQVEAKPEAPTDTRRPLFSPNALASEIQKKALALAEARSQNAKDSSIQQVPPVRKTRSDGSDDGFDDDYDYEDDDDSFDQNIKSVKSEVAAMYSPKETPQEGFKSLEVLKQQRVQKYGNKWHIDDTPT